MLKACSYVTFSTVQVCTAVKYMHRLDLIDSLTMMDCFLFNYCSVLLIPKTCRESDELCDELDEAPGDDKMEKFRERWECISNSSSLLIKLKLNPRIAFTGVPVIKIFNEFKNYFTIFSVLDMTFLQKRVWFLIPLAILLVSNA